MNLLLKDRTIWIVKVAVQDRIRAKFIITWITHIVPEEQHIYHTNEMALVKTVTSQAQVSILQEFNLTELLM